MSTLNQRSRNALVGVHPDLVRVVELAASRCEVPMVVTEGLRNLERQAELKAAGKSWTLNSRHLTGHAIDIVDGDNYAYDIPDLDKIAAAMKAAAVELNIPIVWGGDWKTRDTPHFELCRTAYQASGVSAGTQIAEAAQNVVRNRGVIATAVGGTALTVQQAAETVTSFTAPIVPPVPPGVAETVKNLGGWSGLTSVKPTVLLFGALAFAAVVLAMKAFERAKR